MRPTGLIDPEVVVRPTKGQIDDLMEEIKKRTEAEQRVLVTTLTKKMAEDLTDYLLESGIRVRYLHADIDTVERIEILRDLRLGEFDVLVGINLLREGLDLPEVSLVAILDADKEGYLRSQTSLIQTIGRAARHVDGQVIMYADEVTDSMRTAISETQRRRMIQSRYNEEHGIDPQSIRKAVNDILIEGFGRKRDGHVPSRSKSRRTRTDRGESGRAEATGPTAPRRDAPGGRRPAFRVCGPHPRRDSRSQERAEGRLLGSRIRSSTRVWWGRRWAHRGRAPDGSSAGPTG